MAMSRAEMLSQFFAGAAAAGTVLLATHWMDTLKLLGQLGPVKWAELSPLKLYMGIGPALLETTAYNGINFGQAHALCPLPQPSHGPARQVSTS